MFVGRRREVPTGWESRREGVILPTATDLSRTAKVDGSDPSTDRDGRRDRSARRRSQRRFADFVVFGSTQGIGASQGATREPPVTSSSTAVSVVASLPTKMRNIPGSTT